MPLKNQALTVCYVAWNTSTNQGQTGDASNHTLKVVQDGTEASPTNSPSEVDSTNLKGVYKLALTSGDMNYNNVLLGGASSTANVVIIPINIMTERGVLPTVAPTNSGGFITFGTGTGQLNVDGSGNADANLVNIAGSAVSTTTAQLGVNVVKYNNHTAVTDTNNYPSVNLVDIAGSAVSTSSAQLGVNLVNIAGSAVSTSSAQLGVNVVNWSGGAVPSPSQTGVPISDPHYWNGTAFVSVATSGIPDVNVKNYNNQTAATDGNNYPKVDVVDIAGSAVSTGSAQLGVNLVNIAGSAVSATTAQLGVNVVNWNNHVVATPNHAGYPLVDLEYVLGTTSAGAAGYVGIDWSAINAPSSTVNLSGTTISTSQVAASVTAAVTVSLTQALSAARALDTVSDTSLTLNDAFHCAIAGAAGIKDASSGTSLIIETPHTGTTLRTYTITTTSVPSSVPDKIA